MRMKLDFSGFVRLSRELEHLGGSISEVEEKALEKTFDIVTAKAERAAKKENYPAEGDYSTGDTAESLVKTCKIYFHGTAAEVKVGFNVKEGGLASIFMMYGTPRYMKVQSMYDAFFGKSTLEEVRKAQYEVFFDAVRRLGG